MSARPWPGLPTEVRSAIDLGEFAFVHTWLDGGGEVNARDGKGRTALMLAATQGQSLIVQELIERGADLEAQQGLGTSALMFASFAGEVRVVMQLLLARASVTSTDTRGLTAANYAALKQRETVRAVLKQQITAPISRVPLFPVTPLPAAAPSLPWRLLDAARCADVAKLRTHIGAGGAVDARDDQLCGTLLTYAAVGGHDSLVAELLASRASVDIQDRLGCTPLAIAAAAGRDALVHTLLKAGALVRAAARVVGARGCSAHAPPAHRPRTAHIPSTRHARSPDRSPPSHARHHTHAVTPMPRAVRAPGNVQWPGAPTQPGWASLDGRDRLASRARPPADRCARVRHRRSPTRPTWRGSHR